MTSEFKRLRDEVDRIQAQLRAPQRTGRNVHNEARIERLRKQVERLEQIVPTPMSLGTIVANQTVVSYGSYSFDASYDTGGEAIDLSHMPGTVSLIMPGQQGYTFEYDSAANKIIVYDAIENEAGAATNLSVLADIPYLAIGQVDAERLVFRAREDMLLHGVEIEVGSAFSFDNSDYWTLTLVRRTSGGERVELGDPLSLQSRSLAADTLVTLYLPDEPLRLNDSDTIHVEIVETGTPAYLSDLVVWVDARRRTA